ncbi:MAG TPA: NADH-quinone oxidoreductase subunit M [Polyangiaceae bacterium]
MLSRTLWVMVALPLLGLAWHLVLWRRRRPPVEGDRPAEAQLAGARTVGVGTAVVTAAAVLGHVIALLRLDPASRAMLDPLARGVPLGGLEAPLDLWMDGRAAVECTLACAVGTAAAVVLAMRPPADRGWRPWAWLHLALAGAMLSFLADGFAGLALGWSLSAAAGAWLAGWSNARAAAVAASRGALAVASLALGAVLLFWALGGDWDADDYGPDAPDGIAAAHLPARTGAATVSMTAPGGALAYADDSRVSLARVPFVRAALPAGSHVVRVVTGAGGEEAARVTLAEGDEAVLVPLGPTLSMHAMRDELAVTDARGDAPVRQALEQRVAPGGVSVVAAALLLFLCAAAAMNGARPANLSPGAPGPLVAVAAGVLPAMLGPALLLRLEPLFPSARHTGTVVATVGAAMVLGAMWQALAHEGLARWLVFTLGAPGGLTCAALGMGGGLRGLVAMAVVGAGCAALHLVATRRSDVAAAPDEAQEASVLVSVPERLGALLASMERWVVGAVATAVAAGTALAAWMLATADRHVVSTPGDRIAVRVARAGRRVPSLVGMPLGRVVWAILAALAVLLACTVARAAPGPHAGGRIVLSLPGGGQGPLELGPGQGGWVGTMTVTNVGADPLIVSRVAIRGDEDDVRSPARVAVRFAEGAATSATLAPGAAKDLVVSWMPDRDPRVRQAFGHVVVTSTDEEAGEVAMGFRAQAPTGLGWLGAHALSLLVGLPLLVVLAAGIARSAGRRDDPIVARTALGVAVAQVLLALWTYARFVPDVGRADGNDGFQFVERAVWVRSIGAEWYVGLDGVSAALVPLAAVLWLVAIVVARVERRSDAHAASLALLASAVTAALVALDLAVLFAAWQLVLVALVMLVGGWGGARAEHAAAKIATYGALGSASLLGAFVALSRASGPTYLVDGTAAPHTLAVPELARTTFALHAPIAGIPFVDVAWLLLFVGVAVATPIVPLHGWLPEALEEAPAGAGIMLAGVVTSLGPYLLVRVGLAAMPEGARWAGASIAALGVLSTAYAGLCAMAQRDLRRFVAYATIASGGCALLGIGAFTAQGLAGAVAALFARGLAAAMLLGVAAALAQRVKTCALDRFGGLATETPALAALAAAGLATSLGVPCLAGFWGPLLAMLGSFARHPVLATVFAVALVATAAAHLRAARMLLLGHVDPAWKRSTYLEPFGGRLPDAAPREVAALVPLAVIALLLGLWPTPLLASMAAGVRDVTETVQPATGGAPPR